MHEALNSFIYSHSNWINNKACVSLRGRSWDSVGDAGATAFVCDDREENLKLALQCNFLHSNTSSFRDNKHINTAACHHIKC